MFQDIIPHEFHNEFTEQPPSAGDYLLCFQEERLLATLGEGCLSFPRFGEFSEISVENCRYLFSVDDCHFYWYDAALVEKEGYEYLGPQALRNASPGWQAFAGAVGLHLVRWYRRRRFCGQCGKKMEHHHLERALFCPACGLQRKILQRGVFRVKEVFLDSGRFAVDKICRAALSALCSGGGI